MSRFRGFRARWRVNLSISNYIEDVPDNLLFYCDMCDVRAQDCDAHRRSDEHTQKLQKNLSGKFEKMIQLIYRCKCCDHYFARESDLEDHVFSDVT